MGGFHFSGMHAHQIFRHSWLDSIVLVLEFAILASSIKTPTGSISRSWDSVLHWRRDILFSSWKRMISPLHWNTKLPNYSMDSNRYCLSKNHTNHKFSGKKSSTLFWLFWVSWFKQHRNDTLSFLNLRGHHRKALNFLSEK